MNEEVPSQSENPVDTEEQSPAIRQDSAIISEVAMVESEDSTNSDVANQDTASLLDMGSVNVATPLAPSFGSSENTPQPQMTVAPGKKAKKPFVIGGIIVGVLALLSGGAAFAYNTYQSPENVMLGAMSHALGTKQARISTTVTSDFAYSSGDMKLTFDKLTFVLGGERTPKMDTNATLSITYNGEPVKLAASVLATDDGTIYFKIDNLKSTLKTVLGDSMTISATAESYLDNIDGKWAKYTLDDMKSSNPTGEKTTQCVLDAYKQYKDDQKAIQEVVDLYKKQIFLTPADDPQIKDGNIGYVVTIDKTKMSAFGEGLETTTLGEAVKACDTSDHESSSSSSGSTTSEPDGISTTTTVWISQWTHELRAVDTKTTGLKLFDDETYSVTTHTDIDFTAGVTTSAPSDTMTTDEWGENVQNFYMTMFISSYNSMSVYN
jgi:hypothetical protein